MTRGKTKTDTVWLKNAQEKIKCIPQKVLEYLFDVYVLNSPICMDLHPINAAS